MAETHQAIADGLLVPLAGWEGDVMEATVTIEEVIPKEGKRPYKIMAGGMEYTTYDDALAQETQKHLGAPAKVNFTVKERGDFVNRWLNGVEVVGEAPQASAELVTKPQEVAVNGNATSANNKPALTDKDRMITRTALWKSTLEGNPLPASTTMSDANAFLAKVAYVVKYAMDDIYGTEESIPF